MIVNVRMADGRTTFQFASRKDFRRALGFEPESEESKVQSCWVKWNPGAEEPWNEVRVVHIRKHSVAFVVAAEDVAASDDDLPAKATAEKRKAEYEAREAEAVAS